MFSMIVNLMVVLIFLAHLLFILWKHLKVLITSTEMSNNINISGPSNVNIIETSILYIQVPVTPKRMTNTTNKSMERKWVFSDSKVDDLNTLRKHKRYWDILQPTVSEYKCETKLLHNQNM